MNNNVLNTISIVCDTPFKKIENSIVSILGDFLLSHLIDDILKSSLKSVIYMDLQALAEKDPATNGDLNYVFESYNSFKAVMYYRIAHKIYTLSSALSDYKIIARKISEHAKLVSGIEIHPAASIGKRFVIDHGIGTVIGETSIIGDDCYLLQGVLIGANGIANNSTGKRHPTIGNHVEIGAFTRVLGDITIGDNVKISPFSIIKQNISKNTKVISNSQCQIVCTPENQMKIFGIIPIEKDEIHIHGNHLNDIKLEIVDQHHNIIDGVDSYVIEETSECIKLKIYFNMHFRIEKKNIINLSLLRNNQPEIIITNSAGIIELVNRQKKSLLFDGFKI